MFCKRMGSQDCIRSSKGVSAGMLAGENGRHGRQLTTVNVWMDRNECDRPPAAHGWLARRNEPVVLVQVSPGILGTGWSGRGTYVAWCHDGQVSPMSEADKKRHGVASLAHAPCSLSAASCERPTNAQELSLESAPLHSRETSASCARLKWRVLGRCRLACYDCGCVFTARDGSGVAPSVFPLWMFVVGGASTMASPEAHWGVVC